jgi:hypothetical protein
VAPFEVKAPTSSFYVLNVGCTIDTNFLDDCQHKSRNLMWLQKLQDWRHLCPFGCAKRSVMRAKCQPWHQQAAVWVHPTPFDTIPHYGHCIGTSSLLPHSGGLITLQHMHKEYLSGLCSYSVFQDWIQNAIPKKMRITSWTLNVYTFVTLQSKFTISFKTTHLPKCWCVMM